MRESNGGMNVTSLMTYMYKMPQGNHYFAYELKQSKCNCKIRTDIEISPYPNQKGCHQEIPRHQMLVKMCKEKENLGPVIGT